MFYGGLLGPEIQNNKFHLDPNLIEEYRKKKVQFGFNGLGEIVYLRTYSREKENGENETWIDTIERVVNGVFEILQHYVINILKSSWDSDKANYLSRKMFIKMFEMKFLPPGRGLWAMGSPIIRKKGFSAALNNCAFVSTIDLKDNKYEPFLFLMDASMLGVGVGFDTLGANSFIIPGFNPNKEKKNYIISDDREGWVHSVKLLLESYFDYKEQIEFDYSNIREAGTKLKIFGGTSSGPEPLITLHNNISEVLNKCIDQPINVTCITDIMNMIGVCTISGNIRRSAEIAFGNANCKEFLNLKNYDINPQRMKYGWTSNNSVFANIGMNYSDICENIMINGEPGIAWLSNMRNYSRMIDHPDNIDHRVSGGNPCLEQSLESMELCCLVETFPTKHESYDEFKETLYYAFLYAKVVTLLPLHWNKSNDIIMRNRRIGCSVSGIAQFITKFGIDELKNWLNNGYKSICNYDIEISDWLCVRQSIKKTSVKPSGTISLLAGATPGIHYPESKYYIRRMRITKTSLLLSKIEQAGYNIEPCVIDPNSTLIVEFPIKAGDDIRSINEISMWEQLSLAAFMQRYWADNQVSATITFKKEESSQIIHALNYFQYQLKGISFLPKLENDNAYKQMPYESITEEKYNELYKKINKNISLSSKNMPNEFILENQLNYCDGDKCIKF